MEPEGGPEKTLVDLEAGGLGGMFFLGGGESSLATLLTRRMGVIFRSAVLSVKDEGQESLLKEAPSLWLQSFGLGTGER